jgi:natural product precursor
MKNLNSKLKLNQLNKSELEKRQMNSIRGGQSCACGCGGSATNYTNGYTNYGYGYTGTSGWGDDNDLCYCSGTSETAYSNAASGYDYGHGI